MPEKPAFSFDEMCAGGDVLLHLYCIRGCMDHLEGVFLAAHTSREGRTCLHKYGRTACEIVSLRCRASVTDMHVPGKQQVDARQDALHESCSTAYNFTRRKYRWEIEWMMSNEHFQYPG